MQFKEVKVYNDGSHYIGIPHTTRPNIPRKEAMEEEISILDDDNSMEENTSSIAEGVNFATQIIEIDGEKIDAETGEILPKTLVEPTKIKKKTTRKDLFNELYRSSMDLPKGERKTMLIEGMRQYFKSDMATEDYVTEQLDRKYRNLVCRRIRLIRKANLQDFNYFVTFTYDDEKHSEDSFRKKLKRNLSNNCDRKGWKYIGVWERSPEKKRLHFHGIFSIPKGMMQGELVEVKDFSLITHKMQVTLQNTHFNEKYGRSDFEPIDNPEILGSSIAYLLKYIEKTGEKIVYSRGLPQFFLSDIMDNDIVCPIGLEDKKLLLFDDFICFNEGEYVGKVSPEAIKQLRKCN
ncbi:MAG: hypothetical protein RSB59_01140 [Clostridia bacterium]